MAIEALRGLARWFYRRLEREYEYLTSDEAVKINRWRFTEAGSRFG